VKRGQKKTGGRGQNLKKVVRPKIGGVTLRYERTKELKSVEADAGGL